MLLEQCALQIWSWLENSFKLLMVQGHKVLMVLDYNSISRGPNLKKARGAADYAIGLFQVDCTLPSWERLEFLTFFYKVKPLISLTFFQKKSTRALKLQTFQVKLSPQSGFLGKDDETASGSPDFLRMKHNLTSSMEGGHNVSKIAHWIIKSWC